MLEEAFKCDYMSKPFSLRPVIHLLTAHGKDRGSFCQPIYELWGHRAKLQLMHPSSQQYLLPQVQQGTPQSMSLLLISELEAERADIHFWHIIQAMPLPHFQREKKSPTTKNQQITSQRECRYPAESHSLFLPT